MASSSTVLADGALTGALQYTAELASAPSFLLAVSFAFVAVVCLVKEVLPQCVGRYRQWRRQSVSMQLAPPRIVLFFACVCCSALVRSGWFLGLAITSPQLMDTSMPLWLFFGMWWVPEMFLTVAYMMLLYYWAKIYSGFRHLALFSRSSFRMKVHILEGVFTLCVWAGQFCIYILVVVMPEGSDASLRAQTADNIYLGLVAFFLSLLPISLYVILRYALQPRVQLPLLANDAVATKLGILTAFWAFGRFVRAIDAVGNLPGVWDWKVDVASNWIWLYLGPIYMFMEVIPEFLVITTTLRRDIMQHQQPEHRSQSARKPSERLGLLHQVRKRIDKKIEVEDLEFTSNVLGKGNFATVYRGYYNGDEVAIKSFDKRLHMDRAFFELFCHEVELMSELRHPNVVRFLGACISSREQIFLVTELVQRGTLRGIIDDETVQIDAPQIDAWIHQIANGMFYLHSLGLIHRDLKSENILVTEDMHLKVADFGVSRFTSLLDSEKERKTMTQQVGSLCWMAPEMLDPATKEYNAKVDVFSYGIILWEMVTRAKPYEEEMLEAIPMLVVGGRRPRIPPCEKRFADLMLSCWQANPDERPSFQDILSYLHTPSAIAVRRSVRHVQEEGVLEEGEGVVEGDDVDHVV